MKMIWIAADAKNQKHDGHTAEKKYDLQSIYSLYYKCWTNEKTEPNFLLFTKNICRKVF